MTFGTISGKGQLTIPKKFWDALKLRAWERIAFELGGDELVIRRAGASSEVLAGSLRSPVPYVGKRAGRKAAAAALAQRHRR